MSDISIINLFSSYELLGAHLALLLGACFLLLAPLFASFSAGALKSVAVLSLATALGVFIAVGNDFSIHGFFGLYNNDAAAFYASVLILSASLLFVLLRKDAFLSGEFLALFLFMVLCLIVMVSSNNLVMIFASLEGSSLALYALIAHKQKATNAALGYFNYGMLGSGFFVMAAAIYYYESASLFIGSNLSTSASMVTSVMFLCVVAYKLSIAPFHMWLSKVYEDAEGSLAGFVSVVPKIAMAVVAYRLSNTLASFGELALVLSCAAMLYASLRSLGAKNAQQMLVFSSVSHSAFALAAASLLALKEFMYYFAVFAFINMALFCLLEAFKARSYDELAGLSKRHPFVAFLAIIMLLDLAALPPFGVFFAKVAVMSAAMSYHIAVVLFMGASSVIMLFAYLRFISAILRCGECEQAKTIYFGTSSKIALYLALAASLLASFGANYLF